MSGSVRRSAIAVGLGLLLSVGLVSAGTSAQAGTTLGIAEPRMQQVSIDKALVTWASITGAGSYTLTLTPAGGAAQTYDTTSTRVVTPLPVTKAGTLYKFSVTTRAADDSVAPTESTVRTMQVRPDRTRIRIMQYNTCTDRCPKLRALSWRAPRIARQVRRVRPDVLAIQEGGTSSSRSFRRLSEELAAVGYAKAKGAGTTYIYYRTASMSIRDYRGMTSYGRNADARHGRRGRNRPAPIRELRQISTNARVLVVSYHLTSLDSRSSDRDRISEYKQINKIVAAARRAVPGIPVVKVGDFNSYTQGRTRTYDSDSHRQKVWAQVERDGFLDVQTVARSTFNRSQNTINKMANDRRNFGPGRHLDHIFVQKGTTSPKWALINRNVSYVSQYSDHDPIWADLDLPSR